MKSHRTALFLLPAEATPYGMVRPPEIVNGVFVTYPQECLSPAVVASYKPPVPDSVTGTQGQIALLNAGKLDAALAAIDAIKDAGQKRIAQIKFNAATWLRADAVLTNLATSLGMSSADVDALFLAAETL